MRIRYVRAAMLVLLGTLVISLQACVEPESLCTSWIYSANLVDTAQSVLSGAGAARSTYGGCVGATGQDYTVRVKIWTAPGGIADRNALTTISMVNGCTGIRCSTVVPGYYSNNILSGAVSGNYPFSGTFTGLSQVSFARLPLPHELTGWEVEIYY